MVANVYGYRKSSFTTEDGQVINGFNVYLSYDEIDPRYGMGVATSVVWVSDRKVIGKIALGECNIEFNHQGKVHELKF